MQFERFDLLARVLEGQQKATYDLSSSDMPEQRLSDYAGLADLSLAENHVGGSEELRAELARLYGGHAGDYLVTAGASEANFAVFATLLNSGDPVLVEHPTYQPLDAIPRGLGAAVHPLVRNEGEGFQLTADRVRAALPPNLRLLALTNLNNPTGVALDADEVQRIADLAEDRGFYVLVDEIFRELAFDHESPTMGGINERTIVTSSVSKYDGAGGLKIGWIRATPDVRQRLQSVLDYLSSTPAGPSEAIALAVLRGRKKTAARNRRLIEAGRKVAREWAESEPDLVWHDPVAHLAFPNVGGDTLRLADLLLKKYHTFIAPGESFGIEGHFRLNIGKGAEGLQEGLRRVSQARSALRKT
ncbi:MAG TPA: pyridoxal phosphate-dependent aminotransferase [Thermoplasmata archaeon]|nr:pyridoxal phosphate-dependent aminotransferase [Thermoplasmata archaeon]